MASIRKEIHTRSSADEVWAALRDVGALHTRLVPGFVVDTVLDGDARIVTFGNGMVIREPILEINDATRRVAWTAVGGPVTHYNSSAQVFGNPDGSSTVVWLSDLLPNEAAPPVEAMMTQGAAVMKATLDRLTETATAPAAEGILISKEPTNGIGEGLSREGQRSGESYELRACRCSG